MFSTMFKTIAVLLLSLAAMPSFALEIEKITDNVYALVGDTGQRSATNYGNNATFGVIVTSEGVVLIDSGATWKGAQQIEQTVRKITKQPVKLVINTGGQDHRWLGNGYFKEKGAKIIASKAAVEDQRKRSADQLNALSAIVGDEIVAGTQPVYADVSFDDQYEVTLGETSLVLHKVGPAHTPGDSTVWMPKEKVAFTGDVVYVERMLGVLTFSNSRHWLEAFDAITALAPEHLVPGHGHTTTLAIAKTQTYDYLVMLRDKVALLIASGAGMERAAEIDQSAFSHLQVYEEIKGRNAQQVYSEMEWE
jgi:glyoxylase-like metal-dependent hydrolase (beta-lactamase superfamily II)